MKVGPNSHADCHQHCPITACVAQGMHMPPTKNMSGSASGDPQHTLHLSLGVDYNASIVLKVDEDTILSPPRLPLPDNNGWHDCTHRSSQLASSNHLDVIFELWNDRTSMDISGQAQLPNDRIKQNEQIPGLCLACRCFHGSAEGLCGLFMTGLKTFHRMQQHCCTLLLLMDLYVEYN